MEANLASRVSVEHRLCGRGQEKNPFIFANVAFFQDLVKKHEGKTL